MGKQLSSFEQKILRDGMNSKSSQAAKLKEQLRIQKLYGLHLPLAKKKKKKADDLKIA